MGRKQGRAANGIYNIARIVIIEGRRGLLWVVVLIEPSRGFLCILLLFTLFLCFFLGRDGGRRGGRLAGLLLRRWGGFFVFFVFFVVLVVLVVLVGCIAQRLVLHAYAAPGERGAGYCCCCYGGRLDPRAGYGCSKGSSKGRLRGLVVIRGVVPRGG